MRWPELRTVWRQNWTLWYRVSKTAEWVPQRIQLCRMNRPQRCLGCQSVARNRFSNQPHLQTTLSLWISNLCEACVCQPLPFISHVSRSKLSRWLCWRIRGFCQWYGSPFPRQAMLKDLSSQWKRCHVLWPSVRSCLTLASQEYLCSSSTWSRWSMNSRRSRSELGSNFWKACSCHQDYWQS